jgi:hypothetical protein
MSAQVVSVLDLVEHRPVIPLATQIRDVVDKAIWGIGTVDPYWGLVGKGDRLFLKVSNGRVEVEEDREIALQCRFKGDGRMTTGVDNLTRKAVRVLRNRSSWHRM